MIKNSEPMSMSESIEYLKKSEETDVAGFMKKFIVLKPQEAKELKKKLEELDLMKLRNTHIAKIIDLLPGNREELNKICVDTGLDEDETKKILETIKEFK